MDHQQRRTTPQPLGAKVRRSAGQTRRTRMNERTRQVSAGACWPYRGRAAAGAAGRPGRRRTWQRCSTLWTGSGRAPTAWSTWRARAAPSRARSPSRPSSRGARARVRRCIPACTLMICQPGPCLRAAAAAPQDSACMQARPCHASRIFHNAEQMLAAGVSPTAIREVMLLRELRHDNIVHLDSVHLNRQVLAPTSFLAPAPAAFTLTAHAYASQPPSPGAPASPHLPRTPVLVLSMHVAAR